MSTAFLFPGQGSQHVGMGLDFVQHSPEARAVFDQADEILGMSLSSLCFTGPEAALINTINQQPAIFTTSMAVLAWLRAQGWPPPHFVAGHSLGEFSALAGAGVVSFADGLQLVRRRGELMKQAGELKPGAMAAVLGLDIPAVQQICKQASQQTDRPVQVANDNCPGQVVISGDAAALEAAMSLAEQAGARKVVRLPISIAAHSPLMVSVAAEFAAAVEATPMQEAACPVVGNVAARPLTTPDEIRTELKAQLTAGVAWTASMNWLLAAGVHTFVEVGPGDTLLSFIKRIDRGARRVKPEAVIGNP
jgi:[acyl-carrier-protein] S-malonyltransferase